MAVSIRLRREGALNRPYYKVVVTDKRSPRDGKFHRAEQPFSACNCGKPTLDASLAAMVRPFSQFGRCFRVPQLATINAPPSKSWSDPVIPSVSRGIPPRKL